MSLVTSSANPRIKQIRKLRERKERQSSGLFYVEGLRIIAEAAQQGAQIDTLIAAPELLTSEFGQELADKFAHQGVPVLEVSAPVFETLSLKEGPAGLAAVIHQQWSRLEDAYPDPAATWVALDSVADPGNLGTILRTHDAVAGKGVILLDHSTDPYDPTAIRASMGAVFTQQLVRASFAEFALWKREHGVFLVGTSDKAQTDYARFDYPERLVILMGSERQGLQPQHLDLCDAVVAIPMRGSSDSLNLAVATGVVLYEIHNQRRGLGARGAGR
ncbi:MAG TPA: RNA methyltransferase [Anaerolineaceae bacterium]